MTLLLKKIAGGADYPSLVSPPHALNYTINSFAVLIFQFGGLMWVENPFANTF